MQLDERKAESGVAPAPPQNLSTGRSVATSNVPIKINDKVRQAPGLMREGRTVGSWLAANGKVTFGLSIVFFFIVVALVGPLLIRQSPTAFSADVLQPPSAAHWLGTTQTGQDVFAQVIVGTRVSLLLGFGAGLLATIVSVIVGLTAGYFGGLVDDVLSLLINVFLVIPAIPLAIIMAAYLPFRGPLPMAIIVTITGWAWGARVLRAQTLSMRKRDFVEAARASGESRLRIVFVEILPNEIAIVAAGLVGTVIYAILAQVGLEFLGLGDVTTISWGTIFYWAQNNEALLLGAWWWFLAPGCCVALLGAGLAFINFGIDELANPRLREERKLKQPAQAKKEAA
ncbi:MAG TPA: ABC transporter permease [Ktedonobacteraceae bacterium]|nr:ABC transporter permease [Ktedonobacteraceae bacterium]